jgi:hypothetical protein
MNEPAVNSQIKRMILGISMQGQSKRIQGITIVVLATVFWSTSGIFISLILRNWDISVVSLAFWRDLTTFSTLFIGTALLRPSLLRVKRKDLPWLLRSDRSVSSTCFEYQCSSPRLYHRHSMHPSSSPSWPDYFQALPAATIAVSLSVIGTILISGIWG